MNKEKRLKNLSSIAKRIAEYRYDKEHEEITEVVESAAREYGCSLSTAYFFMPRCGKDSVVNLDSSRIYERPFSIEQGMLAWK